MRFSISGDPFAKPHGIPDWVTPDRLRIELRSEPPIEPDRPWMDSEFPIAAAPAGRISKMPRENALARPPKTPRPLLHFHVIVIGFRMTNLIFATPNAETLIEKLIPKL